MTQTVKTITTQTVKTITTLSNHSKCTKILTNWAQVFKTFSVTCSEWKLIDVSNLCETRELVRQTTIFKASNKSK